MDHKYRIVLVVAVALLMACSSSEPVNKSACHADISAGEVQDFGQKLPSSTEGLAFGADGQLYVQLQDKVVSIIRVSADGTYEPFVELPSALGLATNGTDLAVAGLNSGELYIVDTRTGVTEALAANIASPNFVIATPWDTWLVADDLFGENTITEVTPTGDVSIWFEGVSTPNGMAFSKAGDALYVAKTFEDVGVAKIAVNGQSAGQIVAEFPFDNGSTPDGLTIDQNDNVYVALNVIGEIQVISAAGEVSLLTDDAKGAASMAFGQGDFDPCSIYASNLLGKSLLRIGVGEAARVVQD